MTPYAVLTGDIVESSSLGAGELQQAIECLRDAAVEMSGWANEAAPETLVAFSRRGGDGWQIAMQSTGLAVRSALFLQASLRAFGKSHATRIAIAVGDGQLPVEPRPDLNAAHGPVFTDSGRLLDTIRKPALMAHAAGGACAAALRLADHIAQGWTPAQARAIAPALWPNAGPRSEIAEHLGISRQAVNQALWSGGYLAISDALDLLESTDT